MKELIILHNDNIDPVLKERGSELIKVCNHIDYIQQHLPKGIDIAWLDRENDNIQLI